MKALRLFFLLVLFNISLFANVVLNAPNSFTKGEPLIFSFEAVGNAIDFPKIDKIDNYLVENLGTSRSIQVINGDYKEQIKRTYRLFPKDDITIPSFTFTINDQEFKTKEKQILAKKVEKTVSKYFDLTLIPSKKSLYVGEELIIKLVFKYKRGLQITNLGFDQPHFNGFWYKRIDNSNTQYEKNGYIIQELEFLLFAQKSGTLEVDPLKVDVQMVDTSRASNSFSFFTTAPRHIKVYSNKLQFEVKELPQNLTLIGDFDIKTSIDKNEINQGEAVSYKIEIKGNGNFDELNFSNLKIDSAAVYENKPTVKTKYTKNGLEGTYEKVYSIVPEYDTTIPSIELKYFDKKLNKVISKKSESFNIKVKNAKKKEVVLQKPKPKVEEKTNEVIVKKQASTQDKILYFIFGVISTLLIIGLYWYVINSRRNKVVDTPLVKLVKKSKTKDDLLKLLIPYVKKDENLDLIIFELEKDVDLKKKKKELVELLNEIKI